MAVSQYANRYGEPAPAKKAPAAPAAKKVFKLGPNRRADFGQRVAAAAKAKPKPVAAKPKAPVKAKAPALPRLVTSPPKSVNPRGSVVPKAPAPAPRGRVPAKPKGSGTVFQNPGNMLDKAPAKPPALPRLVTSPKPISKVPPARSLPAPAPKKQMPKGSGTVYQNPGNMLDKATSRPLPKGVVNARNMGGNALAKGIGGHGGPMNAPKLRGKVGPKYVTRVKDGSKTAVRSMPARARKEGPSVGNDKRKGVSAKGGKGKGLDIAKFAQEVSGNFGRGVDAVSRFAGKSASDFGKGVEEVGRMNPMRNYGKRQIAGALKNPVTEAGGLQKYLKSR